MRAAAVLLVAIGAGGCVSGGAVPAPFPRPRVEAAPLPSPGAPVDLPLLVSTALTLRGTPYRNGGADPSGFDCSGFVAYVFAQHGVSLPRTVGEQSRLGSGIDPARVAAGDLVFFTTLSPGPSHVGIAISGTEFVHAPSSAGVVRVELLAAPYWSSRLVQARRFP